MRGRKKRVKIIDEKITKKKDNTIINNRYKVLEDLEEMEENERGKDEEDMNSFCKMNLRNVKGNKSEDLGKMVQNMKSPLVFT